MNRSRKRAITPRLAMLEGRLLLSGGLSGTWVGQDRTDLVGPSPLPGPSGVQDVRIALTGLDAGRSVVSAALRGSGGGEWMYQGPWGPWAAAFVPSGPSSASLYFEPYQVETGRAFAVELRYDDGSTATATIQGGPADPNLRMPEAALAVEWVGQGAADWVGLGAAVGPDGVRDAALVLSNLAENIAIETVTVDGPPGISWRYGRSREATSFARLERDGAQATLYLNPDRDLDGQTLTILVAYANGTTDTAVVTAGRTDPTWRVEAPAAPPVLRDGLRATWLGQDGLDLVGAGDVHLSLDGLPAGLAVTGAVLSDPSGATWVHRSNPSVTLHTDPFPGTLGFRRASSAATVADLTFPPARDHDGAALTVRLVFADGSMAVAELIGDVTGTGLRAGRPASTQVVAQPGDDLNDLANRFGSVVLSAGTYRLDQPLVLNNPVTITGAPGAVLAFAQPAGAAPWTVAIKVHAAHTTLDGFAVRFEGPVRWETSVAFGPAIIGTTDDRDGRSTATMVDLTFTNLDIVAPPASSTSGWEEAPRLFRLVSAQNGRIEGNTLKGGTIEIVRGPWRIAGNDYLGTVPGTYANAVIAGRETRDLEVVDNRAEPRGESGKTWRFLVLSGSGFDDLVGGNTVVGLGPRAGDTISDANAPEIILTESYRLRFEGHPLAISDDGRIVQVPEPQGGPARAGDVVAVLSGPSAGTWRRVAQVIDARTYLLDAPLPTGDFAISIAPGFVGATFRDNTLDTRGGPGAANLILAGNHFGTEVLDNHFLGSGFRIFAAATESPEHWGWSHAPMLDVTIAGNLLEDAEGGASLAVEHNAAIRPNQGRVYLTGSILDTTFHWTDAFLAARALPTALTIGDPGSVDPEELVVTTAGNRSLTPGATMRVNAARLDGQIRVDQSLLLLVPPPAAPPGLRLVTDTGSDPGDRITNVAALRFEAVPGAVGYEFRVGEAGAFHSIGTSTTFLPTGLRQGANTVAVRAINAAGQAGPAAAMTFVFDTVAPITDAPKLTAVSDTGVSNSDGITSRREPVLFAAGAADLRIALLRDGVPVAMRIGGGSLTDPSIPADGTYAYSLVRIDPAGNLSTSQPGLVTIDTTPPPVVSGVTTGAGGQVTFLPTGAGDVYEYRVGTAPFRSLGGSTSFVPEGLVAGPNVVGIRAVDLAGNVGPLVSVRIDAPSAAPTGTWLGQDGRDLVGRSGVPGADGHQDIHVRLNGLKPGAALASVSVAGMGGGLWTSTGANGSWRLAVERPADAGTADLYFQPYQVETGRAFQVEWTYADGTTGVAWVAGGAADPYLPMPPQPSGSVSPATAEPPLIRQLYRPPASVALVSATARARQPMSPWLRLLAETAWRRRPALGMWVRGGVRTG